MTIGNVCLLCLVLLSPFTSVQAEGIPYREVAVDQSRIAWGIAAREIWKHAKLSNYAYTIEQHCYCSIPPKSRVYVVQNKVLAVQDLETHRWLKEDSELKGFHTINQLFELIDQRISQKPDSVHIVLNKHLGFPQLVKINPRYRMADDEINYQISKLMQLVEQP